MLNSQVDEWGRNVRYGVNIQHSYNNLADFVFSHTPKRDGIPNTNMFAQVCNLVGVV